MQGDENRKEVVPIKYAENGIFTNHESKACGSRFQKSKLHLHPSWISIACKVSCKSYINLALPPSELYVACFSA